MITSKQKTNRKEMIPMEYQQLGFRLPEPTARRFRSALALAGETMQDILERAVMEYIKREEKKAA